MNIDERKNFVRDLIRERFYPSLGATKVIPNEEIIIPEEVHQDEDIDETDEYYEQLEELRAAFFQRYN